MAKVVVLLIVPLALLAGCAHCVSDLVFQIIDNTVDGIRCQKKCTRGSPEVTKKCLEECTAKMRAEREQQRREKEARRRENEELARQRALSEESEKVIRRTEKEWRIMQQREK